MFRPNLQNEDHRQAWALLQAVPEGQKSAFLVKAILDSARQDALESTLRRILREELQAFGLEFRFHSNGQEVPEQRKKLRHRGAAAIR